MSALQQAVRVLPTRPLPPARLILMLLMLVLLVTGVILMAAAAFHGTPLAHPLAMSYNGKPGMSYN